MAFDADNCIRDENPSCSEQMSKLMLLFSSNKNIDQCQLILFCLG